MTEHYDYGKEKIKMQKNLITDNIHQTKKKIDKTTYEIAIHFSTTSTEDAYDKLKRIIINDNFKSEDED